MTLIIIITVCALLLVAYFFDIISYKTKIPAVIFFLIIGYVVRLFSGFSNINIPNLSPVLPILGTVGLILIVLEGSLELELNKSRFPLLMKASLLALLPMLFLSFGLALLFQYFGNLSLKIALTNAIPVAIISSAIAIPSAKNLAKKSKSFVTYESSLSDIFGVVFFNFITLNDNIGTTTVWYFLLQLLIILIVSFVATLILAIFLNKIKHHVKYAPIILMIILIYAISKLYHLPALIFILLFGLFLGNLDELRNYTFIKKLHPIFFDNEVRKFKDLTTEVAFVIRALFFLLFGFLIETKEILNSETILWAIAITLAIFILRWIFLKLLKLNVDTLLFIAPRGLITVLLFLSIPISQQTSLMNKSLIIQIILLTSILMMIGLMKQKKEVL
ncbi:hypothetical protein ACQ33O_10770 [Ferruginibacter sp. SUN002]|uniref:hypothetical protein n=1 Tax=Ferruginibacter sp. SUN002 TaxID=2937789 RepID=UPI003D366C0C